MTQLIRMPGTIGARQRYLSELSGVYSQIELYDPDYALSKDPAVYLKIMRDPVIAHAVFQRLHQVAGTAWHLDPASDSPADKAVAEIMEELLDNIRGFTQSRYKLAQCVIRGATYAYIEGGRRLSKLANGIALHWWKPERLRDIDKRRIRIVPDTEYVPGKQQRKLDTHLEIWSVERMKWVPITSPQALVRMVYQDREDRLGYGEGLISAIYPYFYAKGIVWKDGLQGLHRWAQGIMVAKVDLDRAGTTDKTNALVAAEYLDILKKMAADDVLVIGHEDEVTNLENSGSGHQMITDVLGYIDRSLTQLILGSVLPTGGDSDKGSMARAEVESESTNALLAYDRQQMDDVLSDTLVDLVWRTNTAQFRALGLGDARCPRFVTAMEKQEDPKANAEVIQILLGAGVKLSQQEVHERVGFRVPAPDEEVYEGGGGQAGAFGFPPMPGISAPMPPPPPPKPTPPAPGEGNPA